MKYLFSFSLILLLLSLPLFGQEVNFPESRGYVSDFANILGDHDREEINKICEDLEKITGAEMAVVVLPSTAPLDVKTYAVKLFEKWGVGKRRQDNGLLILLSLTDRRVEVEVGYGLEGVLPDAKVGEIIDREMIPLFAKGDFSSGLLNATRVYAEIIKNNYYGIKEAPPSGPGSIPFLILVMVVVIVLSIMIRSGFPNLLGGLLGALFGFIYTQTIIGAIMGAVFGFLLGYGGAIRGRGWGGPFGGFGNFGGGGGGGGFGGFGGGRSGGGGAGRSF